MVVPNQQGSREQSGAKSIQVGFLIRFLKSCLGLDLGQPAWEGKRCFMVSVVGCGLWVVGCGFSVVDFQLSVFLVIS